MKKKFMKIRLGCLLCSLMLSAGCCINIGDLGKEEYERTEQLSAPIAANGTLVVKTVIGSITIVGADVTDCDITATIVAKADTEEEAKTLAEQVKIKLEPSADKLEIKVEKPAKLKKHWFKVDFTITTPKQLNLNCTADIGAIKVSNIIGRIKASADVGKIICEEISGDIKIKTNVGKVNVKYAKTALPVFDAEIVIDVGKIDFTGPANLSAQVDASTDVGSIKTDLPLTVTGEISKTKVRGTIGTGEGKLRLRTDVGSITVR